MQKKETLGISELLTKKEKEILEAWIKAQTDVPALKKGLITEKEIKEQSNRFLKILIKAVAEGNLEDITTPEYHEINEFLASLSVSRAILGFSPTETATFIFSLKNTVLKFLQEEFADWPKDLNKVVIQFSLLLDKLGLLTFETYVKGREDIIKKQQKSILDLSTPVIQVWDKILIVPVIGIIDSTRAKQIMENLLDSIVTTKSSMVIMDITGVPVVDTDVANRIINTLQAAKLLGAETILTGISSLISQTVVHLGINFSDVITRASLRDGLELAFRKLKLKVGSMEA